MTDYEEFMTELNDNIREGEAKLVTSKIMND